MNKIVAVFILALGFIFNGYKFKLFDDCLIQNTTYKFFPWADVQQESKSNIYWLICHLAISLENLILSTLIILDKCKKCPIDLIATHNIIHVLFSIIVILNIFTLGNMTSKNTFFINYTVLYIMNVAWLYNKYWIYFLTLSMPIFIECALFLIQALL